MRLDCWVSLWYYIFMSFTLAKITIYIVAQVDQIFWHTLYIYNNFTNLLWHVSKGGLLFCGSKMGNLIKWCFTVQRMVEKEVQCCKGVMFAHLWHRALLFSCSIQVLFFYLCQGDYVFLDMLVCTFVSSIIHKVFDAFARKFAREQKTNKIFGRVKWN